MLMSVIVLPVSAEEYDYSHHYYGTPAVSEFVNIIDSINIDGFNTKCIGKKAYQFIRDAKFSSPDPSGLISVFFDDIDADKIHIVKEYKEENEGTYASFTYYYSFDGNSTKPEEADIVMRAYFRSDATKFTTSNRYFGGTPYEESTVSIKANSTAIAHLTETLGGYVEKLSTPRKLNEYCGEIGTEAEPKELWFMGDVLPNGAHISDYFYDEEAAYDSVYYNDATTAIISRQINIHCWGRRDQVETDPIYGTPIFSGIEQYNLALDYAESADGADALDCGIEGIVLAFDFDMVSDTAPQTGISTAIFAVVALVSGAYVVKRKRR